MTDRPVLFDERSRIVVIFQDRLLAVIRTVIGRNERSGFSVRGKHLLLSARCAPLARQFFKAPSSSLSSRLHLTITISTRSWGRGEQGAINRSIIVRDGLDFATMAETGGGEKGPFFSFARDKTIFRFFVPIEQFVWDNFSRQIATRSN